MSAYGRGRLQALQSRPRRQLVEEQAVRGHPNYTKLTLNTSTAIQQYSSVHLIATRTGQLIAHKVGVV